MCPPRYSIGCWPRVVEEAQEDAEAEGETN
jgi:hypothetical protein